MIITTPSIIVPKVITAAMILAGTSVAEPAAGETAWASGGTYALGDRRIRATSHRVYECVQAHTGRTALPEVDTAYWLDAGPTQRWAPFDQYASTAASGTTSLTYVLQPGFFNALTLYGLVGTSISLTLKDAPGGAVIWSHSGSLTEPSTGYYDYFFGRRRALTKLAFTNLPIRPAAELTITVSNAAGQPVAIGMINVGDNTPIIGAGAEWGGTEYGASVEPTTSSYIKTDDYGNTTIKRRHSSTNINLSIKMPPSKAGGAIGLVQEVLDVPVSWLGSDVEGYEDLNAFGLGTGRLTYDSFGQATLSVRVQGMF